jgi:hypothetical protein
VNLARGVAPQRGDKRNGARVFEARQIVAAMRDDCGLSYTGDLIKDVFDFGRLDVFAAGDVDVFLAIDDVVEAVLVDARGIAGVQQPSVKDDVLPILISVSVTPGPSVWATAACPIASNNAAITPANVRIFVSPC